MVRLVFLGKFGDAVPESLSEVALPEDIKTLSALQTWIGDEYPQLAEIMSRTRTRIIRNHTVAHDLSALVQDGDEIAFLPPMSGG